MANMRKVQTVSLVSTDGTCKAVTLGDLKKISALTLQGLLNIPDDKKTNSDRALIVKLIKETRETMQQISTHKVMSELKKQANLSSK